MPVMPATIWPRWSVLQAASISFRTLASGEPGTVNMEMEAFYDKARDADYIIYIWSLGGKPETLADFLAKSEVFADFKAVKEGNVWCTTPDYFQISNTLGSMIRDMHLMIDADKDTDSLTYLNRLK